MTTPTTLTPVASDSALFYRPREGWFGDVMPLYLAGVCHLFYTHLDFTDHGAPERSKRLKWGHLSTTDFVDFAEHATAIPAGDAGEPDLLAGAGSIVGPVDGVFYAFYVGINPHAVAPEREQVVLRASSTDLETWTKDRDFAFVADSRWYDPNAWRDPFVVPDGDGGWRMLLCAQRNVVPARRGGAVGLAVSPDLTTWEARPPLYYPGTTLAPECPEIFTDSSNEFLLYSTYSDRFAVRYRWRPVGENTEWMIPAWDALDSNDFYAATSVPLGEKRVLVGWLATRAGDKDTGHRQWGGDLVVHELLPNQDGSVGVRPLQARMAAFADAELQLAAETGDWFTTADSASIRATPDSAAFTWLSVATLDQSTMMSATLTLSGTPEEVGIAIRANDDFTESYLIRLEPVRNRFVFDRRPHRIDVPFDHDADRGYVSQPDFEIERPLRGGRTAHNVTVIVEGSCISVYIDDVALTTRGYDVRGGKLGFYVARGGLDVTNIRVGTR
jgi:beta-fructofuranosidase